MTRASMRFRLRIGSRHGRTGLRRGLTLVEAAISILIVGGVLVASVNLVGAAGTARQREADRTRGLLLASELLSEVLNLDYTEPTVGGGAIGLDAGESTATNRLTLDDVDDYHGLSDSPARTKDGTTIPGCSGFTREARVRWIDPDDPSSFKASETGAKLIQVVVRRSGRVVATTSSVRTAAWVSTHTE